MNNLDELKDSIDNLSEANKRAIDAIKLFAKVAQEHTEKYMDCGLKPTYFASSEEYNWFKANHPEIFDRYDIHIAYTFEELERMEMWDRIARESERRIKERNLNVVRNRE